MQFVGKVFSSVSEFYKDINPATLSGAIDILVVKDESTGTLTCSPFHVRFGKFQILRPQDKAVEIRVNGELVEGVQMKVGEAGETFFVLPARRGTIPEDLLTSPIAKPVPGGEVLSDDGFSLNSPQKFRPSAALSDGAAGILSDEVTSDGEIDTRGRGEGTTIRHHSNGGQHHRSRSSITLRYSSSPPAPVPLPSSSPQKLSWMWGDEHAEIAASPPKAMAALAIGEPNADKAPIKHPAPIANPPPPQPQIPVPIPINTIDLFELIARPAFIKENYDHFVALYTKAAGPTGAVSVEEHHQESTRSTECTESKKSTESTESIVKSGQAEATKPLDLSIFLFRVPSHTVKMSVEEDISGDALRERIRSTMTQIDWNSFMDDPSIAMAELSLADKPSSGLLMVINDAIVFPGNLGYAIITGCFLFNRLLSLEALHKRFPWTAKTIVKPTAAPAGGGGGWRWWSRSSAPAVIKKEEPVAGQVGAAIIKKDEPAAVQAGATNGTGDAPAVIGASKITITENPTLLPLVEVKEVDRTEDATLVNTATSFATAVATSSSSPLKADSLSIACATPLPPSPSTSPVSSSTTSLAALKEDDLCFTKSLRLPHEMLCSLHLKQGPNTITFSVNTSTGAATCASRIFLWSSNARVVISDIDGTITKSDALGHLFAIVGKDWTHSDIASLYTKILKNGYQFLYLSSRSLGQANSTRVYLKAVEQDKFQLPDGPVIVSPDRLFAAFRKEVILRNPQEFKIACLRDLQALFRPIVGQESESEEAIERGNPFYAGFGNRTTDAHSYLAIGIPPQRIFVVNPSGTVSIEPLADQYSGSYNQLIDLVDSIFPPLETDRRPEATTEEPFNDFWYWRRPLSIAPLLSQAIVSSPNSSTASLINDPINSIIVSVNNMNRAGVTPSSDVAVIDSSLAGVSEGAEDDEGEVEGLVPAFYV